MGDNKNDKGRKREMERERKRGKERETQRYKEIRREVKGQRRLKEGEIERD